MIKSTTPLPTPQEVISENLNTSSEEVRVNFGPEDVKVGTRFPTFDEAVRSIQAWCNENHISLTNNGNVGAAGKIQFYCTHGIQRKSLYKSTVYINQQKIGDWKISCATLNHTEHLLASDVYSSYSHVKKLTKEDEEYVQGLMEANARNIHI